MRNHWVTSLMASFALAGLAACSGGSTATQESKDFSSPDSDYHLDYEAGMLWANSLSQQLIRTAEDSGSEYPRYEGFSSAVSQMLDLYGGLEEGCTEVVDYNFGSEFPEGPSRDAWVAGCVEQMERAENTADRIQPNTTFSQTVFDKGYAYAEEVAENFLQGRGGEELGFTSVAQAREALSEGMLSATGCELGPEVSPHAEEAAPDPEAWVEGCKAYFNQ
jgi:hypothetical protein